MSTMHWQVVYADEARDEFNQLPAREQTAMIHAVDKLRSAGFLAPVPAFERGPACRSPA